MLKILVWLILSVVIFTSALLLYLYFRIKRRQKIFRQQGLPSLDFDLGRLYKLLSGAMTVIELEEAIYKSAIDTKAPIIGTSSLTGEANLVITDLDLVKRITVKDFDHFSNLRPVKTQKSSKYFAKMLFVMENDQWKSTRAKLTPAFTTGKIKRMFEIFKSGSERLDTYLKQQMKYPEVQAMDFDFAKILYRYSMDVIASCAFGITSKGWEFPIDELSQFEQYGKHLGFRFDPKILLKFMIMFGVPKLADLLKLDILDHNAQTYFANIINDVLKRRRGSGERQNDFLQLMMDVQQSLLNEEKETGLEELKDAFVFDDDYLVANALMFFVGGLDTTQTVMIYALYSLALKPEVQEKLCEEISSVVNKNGGKLTYESLFEMPYMDMVLNETMRLYPATTRVERSCTQDYVVEETGFKIEKGTIVVVPTHGIHTDERYYPNPKRFDPERFSQENKATRHQYAHLPFGQGPRSCIGMRFALVKVKAVIAQIVSSYKLVPCSKTVIPPKVDGSAGAKPKGGMWLSVTAREEVAKN